MKQVFFAIIIACIIIIGNTLLEIIESRFHSLWNIYKEQASPMFFIDTSSSFYDLYSIRYDFPLAVRKTGHFFFYGFIAIFLLRLGKRKSVLVNGIIAISLSIGISIIDETYQYFLIGRSGLFLDVLVDASGSLVLVIIVLFIKKVGMYRDRSVLSFRE